MAELLTRDTSAPAIVVGAVAHAEIAVVAPFGEASGLIARAAEHLVLIAAGLDPYGVIVVEAGHAESGARYSAGLEGYAEGSIERRQELAAALRGCGGSRCRAFPGGSPLSWSGRPA